MSLDVEPAPKKATKASSLGTLIVSEGVGDVDVGAAGASVFGKEDSFRISIPNAQRDELFVPATCVRSINATVQEKVSSNANMLSVEAEQVPIWEGELSRVLEELRQEFSVQGFQARLWLMQRGLFLWQR